jgi:hypothetical protein
MCGYRSPAATNRLRRRACRWVQPQVANANAATTSSDVALARRPRARTPEATGHESVDDPAGPHYWTSQSGAGSSPRDDALAHPPFRVTWSTPDAGLVGGGARRDVGGGDYCRDPAAVVYLEPCRLRPRAHRRWIRLGGGCSTRRAGGGFPTARPLGCRGRLAGCRPGDSSSGRFLGDRRARRRHLDVVQGANGREDLLQWFSGVDGQLHSRTSQWRHSPNNTQPSERRQFGSPRCAVQGHLGEGPSGWSQRLCGSRGSANGVALAQFVGVPEESTRLRARKGKPESERLIPPQLYQCHPR